MNNTVALVLGFILLSFGLADWLFNDGSVWIFLGRKGLTLLETVAFWR
ncbi:MAG: hypothetical protein AAFY65_04715 [Pseudomonadota bacterium]